MHYSKDALRKMAQEAAERFLVDDVPMTDTISKVAASKDLNREQLGRVCAFANHAANAELMKKQAYTKFEIADPDVIWPKNKEGGFFVVPEPSVKTAKSVSDGLEKEANAPSVLETFRELGKAYGVTVTVFGDSHQDVRQLLKSAELLSQAADDDFSKSANHIDDKKEQLYGEIKKALLQGVSMDQVMRDASENGLGRQLQEIMPRLEAEFLIPASTYDDDGPYSMQRAYKQADLEHAEKVSKDITWEAPASFGKMAEEIADLEDQAALSAGTLVFCHKVAQLYADQDFAKVAGPYQEMIIRIEKRAFHPVTKLIGGGLGKAFGAPFKAITKGVKGAITGAKNHRNKIKDWKNLNSSKYTMDGMGDKVRKGTDAWSKRVGQKHLAGKPQTTAGRIGRFMWKHPVATMATAFAVPAAAGALHEVNSKPRITPL